MENPSESDFAQLIIAGMLLAFVLAVAIILFVLIYQKRLAAQREQFQAIKIEHQQSLIHASLSAVEEDRKKFAADLHDEIGAQLALAKMYLSSVNPEGSGQSEVSGHKLSIQVIDEIVGSVRRISHRLQPPVLLKMGLQAAIQDYLEKLPREPISRNEIYTLGKKRFSEQVEMHAYRIFQEAITNCFKHANCSEITIRLTQKQEGFELYIKDNGTGFALGNQMGLGLLNMQSRAEMIHYELHIESSIKGTSLCLTPKLN